MIPWAQHPSGRKLVAFGLFLSLAAPSAQAVDGPTVLVAHLPSTPEQTASRQAEAVANLARYLSENVPGVEIESEIFGRAVDAAQFLAVDGGRVTLVLSEVSFVLGLPAEAAMAPTWRTIREGRSTFRKFLVVQSDDGIAKLGDLKGKSLSIVESAASGGIASLGAQVFEAELDPESWFGGLRVVTNDFEAVTNVLYGQTDAALIAEYNPLLIRHLGKELKTIYESPPLSLPVLSIHGVTFGGEQLVALRKALANVQGDTVARAALATLGWEGFEVLSSPDLSALRNPWVAGGKKFEIAVPQHGLEGLVALPPPGAEDFPFALAVELPDLPLDPEGLGLANNQPEGSSGEQ
jgi:ABC-type phosphate/phosphonate transport system substrate-binding protein